MATYRAPLQAAFARGHLHFNMVDFSAASASMFAQAVVGLLDLALESFSRSRVFSVLLNPCFLARLGVDRADAMTWLDWAEKLGIYHGWDADEKAQQGYARSPLYSWKLGLQRIRLGRYMDVTDDYAEDPARRFGDVIPFADVASNDREGLDAFCRAVEGLLPALAGLRTDRLSGKRWADVLRRLVDEFLDVPDDRPEEAEARAALWTGLDALSSWDFLRDADQRTVRLPLALVREYVQGQFQSLHGNLGEYLIGGVTIAELQPMRPTPFSVVYVMGLGENLFPGSNALSSFDLRGAARLPGDIGPAEARLFDFLTTLVSARKKIYLTYNNRDLVRDQVLLPSAPLLQLKRYLAEQILAGEFQESAVPIQADDLLFLDPVRQPDYQDILVQPDPAIRAATILAATRSRQIVLDAQQEREWSRQCESLCKDFAVAQEPARASAGTRVVRLRELRRFLMLPAAESLRRHLQIEDEDQADLDDDEPLVTSTREGGTLVDQALQQIIVAAAKAGVDAALAGASARFAQIYADTRARSAAPEAAFGEIDQATLMADLNERIHGQGQIERFLRERANDQPCGPVLLGESTTPLNAVLRFPALRLRPGHELADGEAEIRIIGSAKFAWHAPGRFDILVLSNVDKIEGEKIHSSLLEPALLHLALLANTERDEAGLSSFAWLERREVYVHVSFRTGLRTWSYPPGSITSAEAAAFLVKLARDLLQPDQFDLLPFEVLRHHVELRQAMNETSNLNISPQDYHRLLSEAVADDRESLYSKARLPLIVNIIKAQVPEDALDKVKRRFRLLDRGPARFRQSPPNLAKGRRPSTP
jgi:exodeoxyribonuclease V gamma subunit